MDSISANWSTRAARAPNSPVVAVVPHLARNSLAARRQPREGEEGECGGDEMNHPAPQSPFRLREENHCIARINFVPLPNGTNAVPPPPPLDRPAPGKRTLVDGDKQQFLPCS